MGDQVAVSKAGDPPRCGVPTKLPGGEDPPRQLARRVQPYGSVVICPAGEGFWWREDAPPDGHGTLPSDALGLDPRPEGAVMLHQTFV